MVVLAFINKFYNSNVSIKSVFQTSPRSNVFTDLNLSQIKSNLSHPSFIIESSLNTPACSYIASYISILTSAVVSVPFANLKLSNYFKDSSPAFLGKGLWVVPGFKLFLIVSAADLPKTTISKRELAPSLFAPWTDAQAASPAANNPGTT